MLKLQTDSLDLALTHIENFGDTDIFPVPFEYEAIRYCWEDYIRPWLESKDITQWETRAPRRCLTPKHRYGFRNSTQLDPLDTIVFTALVTEIGEKIEDLRIPKEDKFVFSYRFKLGENGMFYDPRYNWNSFQEYSHNLAHNEEYKYVVLADIADFYPRIYLHPLENALDRIERPNHKKAIVSMIKDWNFRTSYGIPVGPASSRLLAELVIDDVDRGLLDESATFCRYIDDFRIFCKDKREAHKRLAFLANILFENHGLTLQQNKTKIIGVDFFEERYLRTEDKRVLDNLSRRFHKIIRKLGITDPYEEINYENLDPKIQEEINKINFVDVLERQINSVREIDIPIVRFALNRLAQFDDINCIDLVLNNIERLYPAFKYVILYIQKLRSLDENERKKVGLKLIGLLENSLVSHLEYHRSWILDTFTKDQKWDSEGKFVPLYRQYSDEFTKRKLILAMGRAHNHTWFKSHKKSIYEFPPWSKRAFLAAISCLPGDEALYWYRSISKKLDPLEEAIVKWVKDNPF